MQILKLYNINRDHIVPKKGQYSLMDIYTPLNGQLYPS